MRHVMAQKSDEVRNMVITPLLFFTVMVMR